MSRRIVINCWGSYGDVFPYLGLAVALKARGHTPVVATAGIYREAVEREGLEYAHVGPDLDPTDETLYARVMHPTKGGEVIIRELVPLLTLALFSHALGRPQRDWPPNVVTTGFVFYNGPDALDPKLEPDEPLSADVLLVDRAPHQLLFPRASAVVHQGGVGTTGQALRSGHPMIVVPHGHDQPDNAHRVKKLGVSRTVYPQHYKAAHVAHELERMLGGDFRARAAAVAAAVRAEGGADAAVAAIERLWS